MLKARQAVVLISCLHSPVLHSVQGICVPGSCGDLLGLLLLLGLFCHVCFCSFPSLCSRDCGPCSCLPQFKCTCWKRRQSLTSVPSRKRAAQPSTASSLLNIMPAVFFPFPLSCRKVSIKGQSVSPRGRSQSPTSPA